MKTGNKIICLSFFLGLIFWIVDTTLDYFFYYEGTFSDLLIYNVPPQELYIRSIVIFFFLIFGIIISILFSRLQQSENSFHSERDNLINILESMDDGVYIVNQQYDIDYINPSLIKHFGPYEGKKCYEYFSDGKEVCSWCKKQDIFAGKTVRWEWYSSKNKKTYDLIDTPIRNPDGSISKLEILRDITLRKQTKEALQKSEERYRTMFDNMSNAVAIYEAVDDGNDFIFVGFNKAAENIENIKRTELMGKNVLQVFPGVKEFGFFEVFQRVWRTGNPEQYPVTQYKDERISGWRESFIYKLPSGEIVAIYSDETRQKQAEEELEKHRNHLEELVIERTSELKKKTAELERANAGLQEVDRLKSIFLASMSHELRTPLNSIIGFTGIILQGMSGEINKEQKRQLGMVKNSASHLLKLINDLLDISKIEAGKAELYLDKFELDDVVKEVYETFSPLVSEKDLELLIEVPKSITLFSDRRRIKQVLMNLVSNAVKFTKQGSVRITVRIPEDEVLEMRVTDTGVGIKKEDMNKLFEPFQQIDMPLKKEDEGTGLGLHLCKKLVNLLGGGISANSEFGRGSEFTFTIPLKYEEKERNEKNNSAG